MSETRDAHRRARLRGESGLANSEHLIAPRTEEAGVETADPGNPIEAHIGGDDGGDAEPFHRGEVDEVAGLEVGNTETCGSHDIAR